MSDFNRLNESHVRQRKRDVIDIATRMLQGQVGIVEGSRKLASISHDLEFLGHFADFKPFVGIDSETVHLPIGASFRARCAPAYLSRADIEIEEYERAVKADAFHACSVLIERFSK